jgi:O-acetylhomoserine/O-acetylserine sulfhydrylase-like pyridoxal-dependent enzyme
MGSIDTAADFPNGLSNALGKGQLMQAKGIKQWGFDTLQIHAGLEDDPRYGHITLPIYNTASFKFKKVDDLNHALEDIASSQNHLYTRVSNVSLAMNAP